MGQSPSSKNYTNNPNNAIFVQGNADIKNGRVVPRVWTTEVTKTAEIGDILISVRAPVGDVCITDYNVVIGRGMASIKGTKFVYHKLICMKEFGFWDRISTGSTFESISSNDIKEAQIFLPNQKEEHRIGRFFDNIDNLITLHQRKCFYMF